MLMVPPLASVNLTKPASYGASVRIQFFGQVELEVVDQRRSVEEPQPQVVLGPARPGRGSVGHRPGQSRGQSGAHGGDPWVSVFRVPLAAISFLGHVTLN